MIAPPFVTRAGLAADLRRLGLAPATPCWPTAR